MIPLSVLDGLQESLADETIFQNWKHRVGRQTELRAKFNAPDLTVRLMGNFQIVNVEGHEITISTMATDEQIVEEIAKIRGLQTPPPIPTEKKRMSALGLESGLFERKMAEIRKRAADKVTQGLAKIDGSVDAGMAKIDAAADTVVAKVGAEVDAQIEEFHKFGDNGGEPL